jgi:spore germination protein KC
MVSDKGETPVMSKRLLLLVILCLPVVATGCWDQKVTQDIFYVVALGADFKDNKYTAYLQFSDFSQVAKTEQGKPSQSVPIWVATGAGLTLPDAVQDVKAKASQPIAFSHVSSYILTHRAIEHGMRDISDYIRRYPDFRPTGWMFGTNEDLMQIMSTSPLFNLSPLTMIEHTPISIAKQYTFYSGPRNQDSREGTG